MQWLAEICIKRPVFACVLVLSLVVVGAFSYFQLGVDRFPRVEFPNVSITTRLTGAAPEDVETEITDKIERAVNTIAGIDELRSVSAEGVSQVFIQFQMEKNIDVAAQEVRDKINQILADLPRDIDAPIIDKVDPDASPILYLAVSADRPVREITEFADKTLRREIESLPGIGQVVLVGGQPRQINLWLDPSRLRSYGLTVAEVTGAVANQNLQLPGGNVGQGSREMTVRMKGRVGAVDEFNRLVVASRHGTHIRLEDVGTAEDGTEEVKTAANIDGKPTVLLLLRRQSGTNTVAVIHGVKARLGEISRRLPAGYRIDVVRDESEYIEASVRTVQEHLLVGAFLAALVVLLFLKNWRSTVIAAIAIPASIISTFALMWVMGFTLNIITLLALTLAVGIVIDDAIVVLENIYRLMEEKGLSPMEAAIEGTREIGLAVLATTLSLVAVFLPVAFMAGIVGRFMNSFGLTMAFAILVSLFVAYTLTPMMASRWLTFDRTAKRTSKQSRFFGPIERGYTRLLTWSMAHRWVIVLACVLTVVSVVPLFIFGGKDFLPKNDESQFEVTIRAPEGTTVEQTELTASRIAREVRALPEVAYTIVLVGNDQRETANQGTVFVKLVDVHARRPGQYQVMDRIRQTVLPRFAADGLRLGVSQVAAIGGGGFVNKEVAYFVSGPDLKRLTEYSDRMTRALGGSAAAVDVDTSLVLGKPELSVQLDRAKAAELGVQVADVAGTLQVMVGGREISTYNEGGEQYEVRARAVPGWRTECPGPEPDGGAVEPPRRGEPRQRGTLRRDPGAVADRPPQPPAAGDDQRQRPARPLAAGSPRRARPGDPGHEDRPGLHPRHGGHLEGDGQGGAQLPDRVHALDHLHVPGARRPVRVVAAPGDDPPGPAPDPAVRAAVADRLRAVAEHLHRARPPRALRGRQEERDPPDRPHDRAARGRHAARRGDPAGEPGPAAADPDDHAGLRGRHAPAAGLPGGGRGRQPRDRLGHRGWPDALAAAHAGRDAGVLLALRRSLDPRHPAPLARAAPPARAGARALDHGRLRLLTRYWMPIPTAQSCMRNPRLRLAGIAFASFASW